MCLIDFNVGKTSVAIPFVSSPLKDLPDLSAPGRDVPGPRGRPSGRVGAAQDGATLLLHRPVRTGAFQPVQVF